MSESRPDAEFWLDSLRREGAAFRAAVTPETLASPVPSCPGWTVADLVAHVGAVYRRHAAHVVRGVTTQPEGQIDPGAAPAGPAVIEWWDESFRLILAALDSTDPAAPAWNWSIQEQVARFWFRRMAHETAVHRWDAQLGAGAALTEPIDAPLAVDGIDERLDTYLAGKHDWPDDTPRGVITLRATDADGHWAVRMRGVGISLLDTGTVFDDEPHAQAAVTGTASDLELALWGRVPLAVLTVEGNPALPEALFNA
ncbi:maleylpyruvate isomerase N-terminal domain-containing protein [Cryptosporangium phraense]|uniref:Maleylpyruvate isomerase family protein n=1 Tax=Cryptosporangium phraense TaxID=2593070 RepID=A0A545AHA7_9ACTN|nr:maleylpyruvate isomerase N-terminal domain-containing protein [Cryptosporangium phraense]TQS40701.1 maleylpyruvate isomerase family protein [Cryptosporangium phraense]